MIGISVIIPVFNTEKYIEECIESVLENDFKNYEIICVNDGSTDSSLSKIEKMAENNNTITVINQENKGQSAARNKAMEIAKGKYVYFLDSDDKISCDALGKMYQYLEKEQLDVLYFSGTSFFDTEELADRFQQFNTAYMRDGIYEECYDGLTMLRLLREGKDYSVSPCIQVLRKDFLKEHDIKFLEGIIHEDNYFSFLVFLNAKRAKCVQDIFFKRRVREDSVMTTDKSYKNLMGYYKCLLNMLKYLQTKNIDLKHEGVVNGVLRSIKLNIHRSYLDIEQEERQIFLKKLNQGERVFFTSVILQSLESEIKLKKKIKKVEKKLKSVENSTEYKLGKIFTSPKSIIIKLVNGIRGRKNA